MDHASGNGPLSSLTVPKEYRALHKYLSSRFADTVVLTFAQIEDLLGFVLPDPARHQLDWWASGLDAELASAQSSSWIQANRSATPNLQAKTVTFDRI